MVKTFTTSEHICKSYLPTLAGKKSLFFGENFKPLPKNQDEKVEH